MKNSSDPVSGEFFSVFCLLPTSYCILTFCPLLSLKRHREERHIILQASRLSDLFQFGAECLGDPVRRQPRFQPQNSLFQTKGRAFSKKGVCDSVRVKEKNIPWVPLHLNPFVDRPTIKAHGWP